MAAVLQPTQVLPTLEAQVSAIAGRHGVTPRLHEFIVVSLMDLPRERVRRECMVVASTLRDHAVVAPDQVKQLASELERATLDTEHA